MNHFSRVNYSSEESQIRELLLAGKEAIFCTGRDLNLLEGKFGSDLKSQLESDLEARLKEIIAFHQQLNCESNAHRMALEEMTNAFISLNSLANGDDEVNEFNDEENMLHQENESFGNRSKRSRKNKRRKSKKGGNSMLSKIVEGKIDLFEVNLKKAMSGAKKKRVVDSRLKEFKALLRPVSEAEQGSDDELQASTVESIPIDPYTRLEIQDPVKNTKCGHIYDRQGITTYIETSTNPRCPAIGCTNRYLTLDTIVDDHETRCQIARLIALREAAEDDDDDEEDDENDGEEDDEAGEDDQVENDEEEVEEEEDIGSESE